MSLSINKAVYYLLSNSAEVTGVVGAALFPVVANEDTKPPFVVYKRETLAPGYTKDGLDKDEVSVSVMAITNDYDEGLDLIEKVRAAMELKSGVIAGVNVKSIRVTGAQEMFINNEYGQRLLFGVKASPYREVPYMRIFSTMFDNTFN